MIEWKLLLTAMYFIIMFRMVLSWFADLENHKSYWKPTAKDHTKWYEVSVLWWIGNVFINFLLAFFLFCGMYFPFVMGVW